MISREKVMADMMQEVEEAHATDPKQILGIAYDYLSGLSNQTSRIPPKERTYVDDPDYTHDWINEW